MDLHELVTDTFARLADSLEAAGPATWDAPSLCAGWRVREVVAHVTMAGRLTAEQFGAAMADAHGDFQAASDGIAARDADLPIAELVAALRSPTLAAWEPPGGGAVGALNHAVVHGLDVTNAVGLPPACSADAARAVLDSLTGGGVAQRFGVDLSGTRLEATDLGWSWGEGQRVSGASAELISLACHRTLADGRTLGSAG